jgi:Ser/Thr protein kinase RdoA (MazF antagonist)
MDIGPECTERGHPMRPSRVVDDVAMAHPLGEAHVNALLEAFALGEYAHLSDGPVASGRLGSIWRLDTERGSWAVKVEDDLTDDDLPELLNGAGFLEAALAAGVTAPEIRRTRGGDLFADLGEVAVRVQRWVEMDRPDPGIEPAAIGDLVARLHGVEFTGSVGVDPWYSEPVGARRWSEIVGALRAGRAPFADELDALAPELVGLEALLGEPPRALRTCHRDLWADNVRRTLDGNLCVFDFDNAGLADPSQELAAVLVEYAGTSTARAAAIRDAYAEAGGPGRVERPQDFAMPVAQLSHIVEEGCRRWLAASTDADRADNEAWVREFLDRPLTREVIDALLSA